jgi:hypothetical protein
MMPTFDPSRCVTFDVEHGHVELSDGEAQLLVPVSALVSAAAGGVAGRDLGRAIGAAALARVAKRIGAGLAKTGTMPPPSNAWEAVRGAPLEVVVDLLGGELAVIGVGNLRVERWGRALVFVLDPCTIGEAGDALLCGALEGALGGVARREVAAAVIDREGAQARVLVGNARAVVAAAEQVRRGAFFTEVVQSLHRASPAGGRGPA